jgi:hemerythrin-like domain-containing protein
MNAPESRKPAANAPTDRSPEKAFAQAPEPIAGFSRCHEGILEHLQSLATLPALLAPAARARAVAEGTLRFFRTVVYEHHQEEERELFPAVLSSAAHGAEHELVQGIVAQLTREHRQIESNFEELEPELKKVARGQETTLTASEVEALVRKLVGHYQGHASYEETEFLPLSERILARNSNHMAALGLSLHLRHALPEVLKRFGARI